MSFWIRKYKIELERLPLAVLTKSTIVVFLCIAILSCILLLLPIQDTIKGDVIIHSQGQPLTLHAKTSGFVHFMKEEKELINSGELIATIEVNVKQSELNALKNLIFQDLTNIDFDRTRKLIETIYELGQFDFREVNNELYGLVELFQQLEVHNRISEPSEMISTINKSIKLKEAQVDRLGELSENHHEVLKFIKSQLEADSALLEIGAISKRNYMDRQKTFLDKRSVLIENQLRQQEVAGEIITDEKNKVALSQEHKSKIEELRLKIYEKLNVIRQSYQEYQDRYIMISPIDGYASIPFDLVNMETVNEGDPIFYLSSTQTKHAATSEMYVTAQNAGKIEIEMPVRIGLSEFDQKEYGIYYTKVRSISQVQQGGMYKVTLDCDLPIKTSYNIELPFSSTYNGKGEVMVGKINLLTKISREIKFNKAKYASLEKFSTAKG